MVWNSKTAAKGKESIRFYIKEKRRLMSREEKEAKSHMAAEKACLLLEQLKSRQEFSWLYCYMDLKQEAGTEEILSWCWREGIRVAVPRVAGKEMDFFEIRSLNELSCGAMGISEPVPGCPLASVASGGSSRSCPVIVPGVAFGQDGSRTGYGGGYYDRFFKREQEHTAIGYCFEFQLYSQVPCEAHDRKVDFIVTEGRIIRTGTGKKISESIQE